MNKMRDEGQDSVEQSFVAALEAARTSPESNDAWDHLEELADAMQRPDEVASLYRDVLESDLTHGMRSKIAERAVRFHEEWFGDTPGAVSSLLSRIIELDPEAGWAFERLAVVLTGLEQWDELLALYDRMLAVTTDRQRRKKLLDDAAHVAKDFANAPDRAVDYLQGLLALEPENAQLASSIERLLERQERYEDLIELWRSRIEVLSSEEARAARVRIAECCIDRLGAPARALEELRQLVTESPGHEQGCRQLERLLGLDSAPAEVRRGALDLLRTNYEAANRPEDAVAALELALKFAEPSDQIGLHREAGSRLSILGRDTDAVEHYAALLRQQPTDADARKQLRQLAQRSERHDLHAAALVAAADACDDASQQLTLLVESAQLHRDELEDISGAIDLYSRVLATAEADPTVAVSVAHELNELYADAERSEERLAVLEKLAELERATAVRRSILGEAAQLADALGDPDRALDAWNRRLELDETDQEALDAIITILERNERWAQLEETLGRRAESDVLPQQRRADLVDIANLQSERLENPEGSIQTWLAVAEEFGHDEQTLGALDRLMELTDKWSDLAEVLAENTGSIRTRAAWMLTRLGDIHREHLEKPEHAARFYGHALRLNPADSTARAGAQALIGVDPCSAEVCEALATAYRATDDWELLLELLEPRLEANVQPATQASMLREAAELYEQRAGQPDRALNALVRAFPLEPADLSTEHELRRLANTTSLWEPAADALGKAAEAATAVPRRAAALRLAEAEIRERELGDETAREGYEAAATLDPHIRGALEGMCRVAAGAGHWTDAARGLVEHARRYGRIDPELLERLETKAEELDGWRDLAIGVSTAVSETDELEPEQGRMLESRVSSWYRDRCEDAPAAEDAARRALEHVPDHVPTLKLLISAQRKNPGPALVSSLLRLDGLLREDIDALREAAELALQSGDVDEARTKEILERLYRKASSLWVGSEPTRGEQDPETCTTWVLDHLVQLYLEAHDPASATQLLVRSSKLPFSMERRHQMLRRAAEILAEQGAHNRAIELYRDVLADRPDDLELVIGIADLCAKEQRTTDLLLMRRRELQLTEDPDRRLELRLQIAELVGELEKDDGRVQALRANLEESPGHESSLSALTHILTERGRHRELADIVTEQARQLEAEQPSQAAGLWRQVARIAEAPIGDLQRAIDAHGRVAELAPDNDAIDALARLHGQRDEPAEEAMWLGRRLQHAEPTERVALLLKLARAQIRARKEQEAIATLETAFAEAPRNAEVRKLLLRLYRERDAWEPLAHTLSTAAEHVADEDTVLAYAREAAHIYHDRLDAPERSVPVLERAVQLAPTDRGLRALLAEGLRAEGRLPEARELLHGLIADFGRRRSPERAAVHLLLAKVSRASGDMDEAIEQLETASKMDAGSITILQTLADLARESGQLERAERAYRTLLLNLRRAQTEPTGDQIGPAETLLELSSIASDRGQQQQADELLESSLEALAQNDAEAPRIQAVLRERGQNQLLKRVLETRLENVSSDHRKAEIMVDMANLLGDELDQRDQAFEALLKAIELDPGSPVVHDATQKVAAELEQTERYVKLVENLLERTRRGTDAHARCELLLRLGEAMENLREDYDRAAELYAQAESTGVRQVDVWRAAARIAAARGDEEEHKRLLERLAGVGEDQRETRVDALYRLAEVQLASSETLEDGIKNLRKALEDEPRYERAGMLLSRATEAHEDNEELLDIYEQIARHAGDDELLLHYLERRASHPHATPEQVREGAQLALRMEQYERGEQLFRRAVEVGESLLDGKSRVAWAFLGLAERRQHAGDLAAAVKWLGEASDVAEPQDVFALGEELAEELSQSGGDLTLAAKLYERLLERDPTARQAWQRLATIYRKLRDTERLERLVDEILDGLEDPEARNGLRLELARGLLDSSGREDDAVEVLRTVLLENPEHDEARTLLADYLERSGKEEELLELLRQQLMTAQSRGDQKAIKGASLRLGKRLRHEDPSEALGVLRTALDVDENDPELIEAVLELLPEDSEVRDRAELLERLLESRSDDEAAKLAMEVVALYEDMGDHGSVQRALERGYRRAPGNRELRDRLEQIYRDRGDHAGLATMMLTAAEGQEDPTAKVELLKQAASLQAESLNDASAAANSLGRACDVAPEDVSLQADLASMLSRAGRSREGVAKLDELIESTSEHPSEVRLDLLRRRADMRAMMGDETGAVQDLETAYRVDWTTVTHELEQALERLRLRAAEHRDLEAERAATIRKIEVLLKAGNREEARSLLQEWTDRERKDVEALRMLRDLDTDDQNWDPLVKTCARLVALERDEDQVHAALRLSYACEQVGRPEDARRGLEHARRKQPDNEDLRNELRQLYQKIGAHAEQARMLMEDAERETDEEQKAALLQQAGELFLSVNDGESAVTALSKVLELRPGDAEISAVLANAHIAAGNMIEADEILDEGIAACKGRRSPELALLQHGKSRLAQARGDQVSQLEWLHQSFTCDTKNGTIAVELADLAEALEEWDLAVRALRSLALMQDASPMPKSEAYLRQGRISHRRGDRQRAVLWARKARQEDPAAPEVAEFLAELGEA